MYPRVTLTAVGDVLQGPPYPPPSDSALLDGLKQRYCCWDLASSLGPVGQRGGHLVCAYHSRLWLLSLHATIATYLILLIVSPSHYHHA
jgi:hypothetical protein